MAKKISQQQVARARAAGKPTTGNGVTGEQKPKLSETNLAGGRGGALRGLLNWTRRTQPGRHE